jgi:hypothetical protein
MSTDSATDKTRTALLTQHQPLTVLDALPDAVFPITAKVQLRRTRDADTKHIDYRQPNAPVTVYEPTTAYVPETRVYFDNPAQRPPEGRKAWSEPAFRDSMQRVLRDVTEAPGVESEDLQLLGLDVVEVPPHLLTTDPQTGAPAVKPDLYEREASLSIARFERVGDLKATAVREELADALPGESRTPTRLTEVREVHAKPSRQSRDTRGTAGTARYYTEHDAEQVDDLSLTPAVYRLRSQASPGDRSRPLSPALSGLDDLLPRLTDTDGLIRQVTFRGEMQQREVFEANEVVRS